MSQPPPFYRRRWFSFAVGVAVSVACLGGILVRLDFEQLKSAFTTADYRAFPLMIGVVFCLLWLNAWRWTWLLRPMGRFETRETFPPLVIGFAMNNILPARLGELIRVHVFCRRHKSAPMSVLAGVALERVFDIVAIVAFFIVGLSFLPDVDPRIHQSAWVLGGLSLAAFASAGAYVLWTERATRILDAVLQRIPLVSDSASTAA
ncbi:MAG: flippase-like domain-containing protein [Planctomycetaceae bacterium]|nr:flippase-like domain-containing protein [Planctomycetaceae bacterium]